MRSKNSLTLTPQEAEHLARVKALPCSWCDGWGGYAHHVAQGCHFLCVATCEACHTGQRGWHGDKSIQRTAGRTELDALNITHARLHGSALPQVRARAKASTRTPSKIIPRVA